MDFVRISHPDIDGVGMCSAAAFDLIYEAKGWQVVDDEDDTAPPAAEPAPGPDPSVPEAPAPPNPAPVNLMEN